MTTPLPQGSTIGILGGGQLGRMTAMAAANLGYKTHIFTDETDSPASHVTNAVTVADYLDTAALKKFSETIDVVTLEFENVPVDTCRFLKKWVPVYPDPDILAIAQDRIKEKLFARDCGIATAPWREIRSAEDLASAGGGLGYPLILKTTRMGYDGKGQVRVDTAESCAESWKVLQTEAGIAESAIAFSHEISVITARDRLGNVESYPAVENRHKSHILHQTIAPAHLDRTVTENARAIAEKMAQKADLVGLLAVEMFVTRDGELLVNEIAPRPHNSGHWTIDACACSQFEQLVRAVAGLPLGSATPHAAAVMTNLLGDDIQNLSAILKEQNVRVHLYGKTECRQGRKMGHVTKLYPLEREAKNEQNRRMGT